MSLCQFLLNNFSLNYGLKGLEVGTLLASYLTNEGGNLMLKFIGKTVFGINMVVLISLSSHAQVKKVDLGDMNMTIDYFSQHVSDKNCMQSEREYFACIEALRLLAIGVDPLLRLETRESKMAIPYKIVVDAQPLILIRLSELEKSNSALRLAKDFFELLKNDRHQFVKKFGLAYSQTVSNGKIEIKKLVNYLTSNYGNEISKNLIASALNEYFHISSDPHTDFRSSNEFSASAHRAENSYEGFGIAIDLVDEGVRILKVSPESGADLAGLEPDDVITNVDGLNFANSNFDQIARKLIGERGSKAQVSFRRNGASRSTVVERKFQSNKIVHRKTLEFLEKRVGYIHLQNFEYKKLCDEFDEAIEEFNEQKVDHIVLDLRGNGGGHPEFAACIAGIFLGPDKVVSYFKYNDLKTGETKIDDLTTAMPKKYFGRLSVLIDHESASASEILAGALREYNRALVVGTRSFGKGSVQWRLLEGLEFSYWATMGLFYLPSGKSNQTIGIEPHIKAYFSPQPTGSELYFLREKDLFLYPLPADRILNVRSAKEATDSIQISNGCLQSKGILATYQKLNKRDFFRDLQLLTAIIGHDCLVPTSIQ